MTKTELETYVGRRGTWTPKLRSSDGALTIPVKVEAVQQRYGRDECRIHPRHGTGAAWVSAESVTLERGMKEAQARAIQRAGLRRVATTPPPKGQKFAPGTRVRIADDLGSAMAHFPNSKDATVRYTYAHAYGGDDIHSYCLDVDGLGEISWYQEHQLTPLKTT